MTKEKTKFIVNPTLHTQINESRLKFVLDSYYSNNIIIKEIKIRII
jgi:hypothetical protein